jgi:hypothetical protein
LWDHNPLNQPHIRHINKPWSSMAF